MAAVPTPGTAIGVRLASTVLDHLEIMVEGGRLCCTGEQYIGVSLCRLAGGGEENLLTRADAGPDTDGSRRSLRGRVERMIGESDISTGQPARTVGVIIMRHDRSAWLPPDVMRDLTATVRNVQRNLPRVTILLGAHAHSADADGSLREDPYQVSNNMVRWSSYTKSHQLALYDPDGTNIDITMV
jgi:hypothetical protein